MGYSKRITLGTAVLVSTLSAMPAAAQELGTSSSGSMTVTLIVPPIAPVLDAQQQGAVGAWTITGRNPGLMLLLPQAALVGEVHNLSFFSTSPHLVEIQAPPGIELVAQKSAGSNGGLARRDFSVAIKPDAGRGHSAGIVFRAI